MDTSNVNRAPDHGRGAGGFDRIPNIPRNRRKNLNLELNLPPMKPFYIVAFAASLLVLWGLTGFYKVGLQERAVPLIFGKHTRTSGPGLHWNPPYPIGQVLKVNTEELKKVEIGFRSDKTRNEYGPTLSSSELQKEREMLTKGTNIVDIQMTVQYVVIDPVKFLFKVADQPDALGDYGLKGTVKAVAESSLREVVGNTDIDAVLTFGKALVQSQVHELLQATLDNYDCGISIQLVQLQDVAPPTPVAEAFRDVNNAGEDKDRKKREAEGYRNSVIPEARGSAAQIVAAAQAYKEERIKKTEGDALRFNARLDEYRKAPAITEKRLYLETMEDILSQVETVIIDPSVKNVMPFLNLESLKTRQSTPPQETK